MIVFYKVFVFYFLFSSDSYSVSVIILYVADFDLQEDKYAIVTDRWQKFTDVYLDEKVLEFLASYADEFLVHGVDVEGKK